MSLKILPQIGLTHRHASHPRKYSFYWILKIFYVLKEFSLMSLKEFSFHPNLGAIGLHGLLGQGAQLVFVQLCHSGAVLLSSILSDQPVCAEELGL